MGQADVTVAAPDHPELTPWNPALRAGERLLWTGRPSSGCASLNGIRLLLASIAFSIGLMMAGILLFSDIPGGGKDDWPFHFRVYFIWVSIVPVLYGAGFYFLRRRRIDRIRYAITTDRVLIARNFGEEVAAIEPQDIDAVPTAPRADAKRATIRLRHWVDTPFEFRTLPRRETGALWEVENPTSAYAALEPLIRKGAALRLAQGLPLTRT